jgi:Zn-dependent protease with chaperone function
MNDFVPYITRLAEVCLACFFLLHALAGLLALTASPFAIRFAARLPAVHGARLLLSLRLLPIALASALTLLVCVPSYIRFEHDAAEAVGLPCLLLALLGLATLGSTVIRAWQAVHPSRARLHAQGRPIFALVGFFRPSVVISPGIQTSLSPRQMEAALRHESAHCAARDNLKRLAIFAAPGLLPFHPTFRSIEIHWARLAEWAADDAATASDPLSAVALAEALLRVARLSTQLGNLPAASSLIPTPDDLAHRVRRLLSAATPTPPATRAGVYPPLATTLLLCLLLPFSPPLLYAAHRAMEQLVH